MTVSPEALRVFAALLARRSGQQLGAGREWRIETALRTLLVAQGLETADQLAAIIAAGRHPRLAEDVVEALLNHETSFFRDRQPFALLTGQVLPRLAEARRAERRLRIWSAGCSNGQELYSIAMAIADQAPRWEGWRIELIGTDVSTATIMRAREGLFTRFEIQRGLPVREMIRHFVADGDDWRARPELRRNVHFQRHNLLDPPPLAGRFDVILCRNVLLYLAAPARRQAFDRLADAIRADGALMLGAGETVIGQTERFISDPGCRGLYCPRPATLQPLARRVA